MFRPLPERLQRVGQHGFQCLQTGGRLVAKPIFDEVPKLLDGVQFRAARRLWAKDQSLWAGKDESEWLGWLDAAGRECADDHTHKSFGGWIKDNGFTHVVLLGMGGSSLGPEVLSQIFGRNAGWPALRILDSTDPAQVRNLEREVDITRTLFIVSSKSGGTTEPNVLKNYFFARAAEALGHNKAGDHFVAVTDPGTSLAKIAAAEGFRGVFHGTPSIGGRYSVLSPFGLVPAASAGIQQGDVITQIGDTPVADQGDLQQALTARYAPGTTVPVTIRTLFTAELVAAVGTLVHPESPVNVSLL